MTPRPGGQGASLPAVMSQGPTAPSFLLMKRHHEKHGPSAQPPAKSSERIPGQTAFYPQSRGLQTRPLSPPGDKAMAPVSHRLDETRCPAVFAGERVLSGLRGRDLGVSLLEAFTAGLGAATPAAVNQLQQPFRCPPGKTLE